MPQVIDINSEVAATIASSGDQVRSAIITGLAQKEIDRRIKAGAWAVEEIRKIKSELVKLKPDIKSYDANGASVGDGLFSQKVNDERKKLNDKLAKISNALDKALGSLDFGDLYSLEKSGGVKETPEAAE